jgi:peptidoglycan/xylan/chitin deacetylase (PgdA/CDA1 family)
MSEVVPAPAPVAFAPPEGARRAPRSARIRRHAEMAVSLVFHMFWSLGHRARCALGVGQPRLVILYYHGVPAALRVRFAAQLDAIRAAADVVRADFHGPAEPGQLLVAITFDDAFVSVLENAVPELRDRGMTATIFTPSGALNCPPSWWMEPEAEDRQEAVASVELLRALPQDVITIGAHSITHPFLPDIEPEAAAWEVAGSRAELSRLLERPIDTFAFPYGAYADHVVALCRAAGYRFAFTTVPDMLDPRDDPFLRGRVLARLDDGRLEFWLKLRGAYSWKAPMRRLKRRLWRRTQRYG